MIDGIVYKMLETRSVVDSCASQGFSLPLAMSVISKIKIDNKLKCLIENINLFLVEFYWILLNLIESYRLFLYLSPIGLSNFFHTNTMKIYIVLVFFLIACVANIHARWYPCHVRPIETNCLNGDDCAWCESLGICAEWNPCKNRPGSSSIQLICNNNSRTEHHGWRINSSCADETAMNIMALIGFSALILNLIALVSCLIYCWIITSCKRDKKEYIILWCSPIIQSMVADTFALLRVF